MYFGVGTNDADYVVMKLLSYKDTSGKRKQKLEWICPFYSVWKAMLERCYSGRYINYEGITVCKEWLLFSNFKRWMEDQDYEGKVLDKDLLIPGSNVYSSATCRFIPKSLNVFIANWRGKCGKWPVGVYSRIQKNGNQVFIPQITFRNKPKSFGSYSCPIEAHKRWLSEKLKLAVQIAQEEGDEEILNAVINYYTNFEMVWKENLYVGGVLK